MELERELRHRLVRFLARHIGETSAERKAILESALSGCDVIWEIGEREKDQNTFVSNMIDKLRNYGRCAGDDDSSLIVLIRYIGSQKGVDVGKIAESFCQDLMRVDSLPEAEIAPIESGRLIAGRYKLLQPIGDDSGQATVWQAQDMNDPQLPPVAIKCMKPHPTRDYASRFIEEVRSLRELDEHPHIMPIYDYGIDGGLRYLVMPQMRGSLRAALDEAGRLSPDVALDYLRQMADALDFAHRHDIIHRDLKPANMLFTRETSRLCLADFGIAYRTHRQNPVTGTGETAATEEYAAPEQLRSTGNVTEKSDIYALAIIAYELLAGERPFKGSKAEIAAQHLDTTLELPEHGHLAPFVLQVLRMGGAKDAALRPQKATDFITHLGDALDGKAPEVIQHYLDEVMPNHLREVMPEEVFKGLKRAFIDPQVEIRQQITIAKPQADDDDDELDWDLFPPDVRDEAPPPPPQIELSGEFHPPREGRYSDQVEYVEDVRGRIGGLQRVVLLGAPGAGKTFMLGRLALDYADGCRVDPAAPLPVFVPLSQYNTAQTFEAFVAARMGALGERLSEHKVLWLLDALNEMPRDKGQWRHLKAFIDQLVQAEASFILTCRVKNYEEDLHDVPGLHRVDLQDLNPQQIYDILTHFLRPKYADPIWETVMHGAGLREAWKSWKGSVRAFWQMPKDRWRWDEHERARGRIHDDPRKLMLLCRNPFTLVRLLVVRMGKAIRRCGGDLTALTVQLEEELPNNRALLFGAVIEDMVGAEAGRRGWTEADHAAIHAALEFTSAALQATEQRTEIALADLLNAENAPANLIEWLRKGRDAGIITLTETAVRFNHQLYQEYFATKKLRDLLADYTRRHPDWELGDALPPRDERLAELFPRWWEVGGWRVTVALLGELEGRTGINRVVRWLASYAPETAANMVADNNDGLTFEDLTAAAREALITSALEKIKPEDEPNPKGRASAGRALGLVGDPRKGVNIIIRDGVKLPDIDWVHIPAGEFTYQAGKMSLDYDYHIARYPVTYAQFQTFIDDPEGFHNPRWWDGLSIPDGHNKAPGDQRFKFWNHPRERVSWYEAIAFCRWFSWRLEALTPNPSPSGRWAYDPMNPATWLVRLPTEFEWEKAARANTSWKYPWGDDYQEGYANIDETFNNAGRYDLGLTSAVGIYSQGDTPHWSKPISDLSGNVWEWCLTDYRNPQTDATNENLSSSAPRVLRGGAFNPSQVSARAAARNNNNPYNRYGTYGFRVFCVRPPFS